MSDPSLNEDFIDLLELLEENGVRFLLVGAHAMAAHGVARATGDMDVWVEASEENAQKLVAALDQFGAPLSSHGVSEADFQRPDTVYQMGLPPRRIDILTGISGVDFHNAWNSRISVTVDGLKVQVLGLADLIVNKETAARDKDIVDAKLLRAMLKRG